MAQASADRHRHGQALRGATNAARPLLNPTMSADLWPRIGGDAPRPRPNRDKATKATEPGQRPSARQQRRQLAGNESLGSLPDGDKVRPSQMDAEPNGYCTQDSQVGFFSTPEHFVHAAINP